jgi:hypothetical protein
MAKRKRSKVQKRGKLGAKSATRGMARKLSKVVRAKATRRAVARAKPKSAPVKKAARKVKHPVAAIAETAAVEVIEQAAPGIITATEVEETRQVS